MIGEQFNRLTVVEDLGMRQHGFSNRARRMVRCHCRCGKNVTTRLDHLQNGHTQSCGCFNREQVGAAAKGVNRSSVIVGNEYHGNLVLKRLKKGPRGQAVYLCKCQCGNIRKMDGTRLLSGNSHLCRKCGYAEHLTKIHVQLTKPEGYAACRAAYCQIRNSCAKARNLIWSITFEDWVMLSQLSCRYCGSPPSNLSRGGYGRNGEYHYNGLDRVDNDVGYTLKNVVPCCKRCNCAKSDQTVTEFLDWARRIASKNPI